MGSTPETVWQNDTAIAKTAWSWIEGHDYKTVRDLVAELVDVVAKNGVLLLNTGPKPDGTLPEEEVRILRGIGTWLARNGEAIYGTRPWTISGEGPTTRPAGSFVDAEAIAYTAEDVRFTTRHDVTGETVYATLLADPADGVARIRALGSASGLLGHEIRSVAVLGHDGDVAWEQRADALVVPSTVSTASTPDPSSGSGSSRRSNRSGRTSCTSDALVTDDGREARGGVATGLPSVILSRRSDRDAAAVDRQHRAVHEARRVRRQEHDGVGDLLSRPRAGRRDPVRRARPGRRPWPRSPRSGSGRG